MRSTAKGAAFVVLACLFSGAISNTGAGAAQQVLTGAEVAKLQAERMGADDGYVAAILLGGDIQGSLDPCG